MGKFLSKDNVSYLWSKVKALVDTKVSKEDGKGLSANDYTTIEKNKLNRIENEANKYEHPTYTEKASGLYKITVDGTGHISDAVTVTKNDIIGLGIPEKDTTYDTMVGASSSTNGKSGLVPVPQKGNQDKFLKGDGTWGTPESVTYSKATASDDGLMAKEDKKKLDAFGEASTYATKSDITNIYKYKGSVDNEDALPSSNQETGDVYNIVAKSSYGAAGMNVAWDGTKWDALGEKFEIEEMTNDEIDAICV